jgi:hypothetical protein
MDHGGKLWLWLGQRGRDTANRWVEGDKDEQKLPGSTMMNLEMDEKGQREMD